MEAKTVVEEQEKKKGRVIKLYSHNTYLIPNAATYNPIFSSCKRQHERAAGIAAVAKQHDISTLQEVWGTQLHLLEDGVSATHHTDEDQKTIEGSWLRTLRDSWGSYWQQHGGLYNIWRKNLPLLGKSRFTYAKSFPFTNQGVSCYQYDLAQLIPDRKLLLFNTHLDVQSKARREHNCVELRAFIVATIAALVKADAEQDWKTWGVILTGDFNIPSSRGSQSYQQLMTVAKMRDLFRDSPTYGDPTEYRHTLHQGDKKTQTGNSMFPWPIKPCRVDYVFHIQQLQFTDEELGECGLPVAGISKFTFAKVKVHDFKIIRQPYGQELSDHYGNSCELEIL